MALKTLRRNTTLIAGFCLAAIATHLILRFGLKAGATAANAPLLAAIALGGTPLLYDLLRKALRRDFGSDLLGGLAVLTSVWLGEYLAGSIIVLMLAGGDALESYAVRSASSVLAALARRVPAVAHRRSAGGIEDIALDQVAVGDTLVIYPHDICPVDGTVLEGHGVMDESYLTGEPFEITKTRGSTVISGAINGAAALTIRTTRRAADSRYAKIMLVMRESEQSRPHLRRLGDRLGAIYTPVALGRRTGRVGPQRRCHPVPGRARDRDAVPAADRDPGRDRRLDLAVRAAGHHREESGRARADRDVPHGHLRQDRHADLRRADAHRRDARAGPLAPRGPRAGGQRRALLETSARGGAARCRDGRGRGPSSKRRRSPSRRARACGASWAAGTSALPAGQKVIAEDPSAAPLIPPIAGGLECVVAIDGRYAATLRFRDAPRPESRSFVEHLGPKHQFRRTMIVSGDRESEVRYLAEQVGVSEVHAQQSPEQKLALVRRETAAANTLYVGDGINDAPAMMAATVGIAIGEHSDVTAEAAGVVVMENSLKKIDEFMHISRRMRSIALQSAVGGMALSVVGMALASAGWLTPVAGAIAQEAIDVVAVLNALRAAFPPAVIHDF